jgi:phenylacetate-CoA ligase
VDGVMRGAGIAWTTWRASRAGAAAITEYQGRRLAALVRHARQSSPYYRRLYDGLPAHVTEPRLLPAVRKPDLMGHFDDWVTDFEVTLEALRREFLADLSLVGSRYLGRYHVFTTSGTTGEPAVILHDADSWAVANFVFRLRGWTSLIKPSDLAQGIRVATLVATGGHFGGVAMAQSARRRSASIRRRTRVLSVLTPIHELVDELNRFQPTMLNGYPSAIALLAAEQQAGTLRISPVRAMTSGEHLTAAMRDDIEGAFDGCRVVQAYGASEAPTLGVQCTEGALHLNTDWYLVEPVDEDHQPVAPGDTSSTVLVTNLANRVQPIIRYDLGDRVAVAPTACGCGSPFPRVTVEGRTGDVLAFDSAAGGTVSILPLALGTVIEETPGVRRFQAIRADAHTLRVRLEPQSGADRQSVWRDVDARLRQFLADHSVAPIAVLLEDEAPQADPRSGKFRQVHAA